MGRVHARASAKKRFGMEVNMKKEQNQKRVWEKRMSRKLDTLLLLLFGAIFAANVALEIRERRQQGRKRSWE